MRSSISDAATGMLVTNRATTDIIRTAEYVVLIFTVLPPALLLRFINAFYCLASRSILPRRTFPGLLREDCPPGLTNLDDDVDRVRRIQREESPCQPQQVVVVVRSFRFSPLQDDTNGIFDHPAVIHPIDRDRSHRAFLA